MKRLLTFLVVIALAAPAFAQDTFTIYLVRHAEKQVSIDNPNDPDLTDCGHERAKTLAHFLSEEEIDIVHSSDYVRTIATANPTAESRKLDIEIYNPNELEDFAGFLLKQEKNALVVGHSNTTDVLVGFLMGADYEPNPIRDSDYDRIYQVVVCGDSMEMKLFHSAFSCE